MSAPSRTLSLAAVAAAAGLGLWGSLELYGTLRRNPQTDAYRIEQLTARYAPVKASLPAGVRTIGYLSDSPEAEPGAQVLFFSAQYALAPRLVSTKPDQEWVLGNFSQPGDWAALGAPHGLRVEQDLGNGLVLYRRAGEPR